MEWGRTARIKRYATKIQECRKQCLTYFLAADTVLQAHCYLSHCINPSQMVVVWNTLNVMKGAEVTVLAKAHTDVDINTMKITCFDGTRYLSFFIFVFDLILIQFLTKVKIKNQV